MRSDFEILDKTLFAGKVIAKSLMKTFRLHIIVIDHHNTYFIITNGMNAIIGK